MWRICVPKRVKWGLSTACCLRVHFMERIRSAAWLMRGFLPCLHDMRILAMQRRKRLPVVPQPLFPTVAGLLPSSINEQGW